MSCILFLNMLKVSVESKGPAFTRTWNESKIAPTIHHMWGEKGGMQKNATGMPPVTDWSQKNVDRSTLRVKRGVKRGQIKLVGDHLPLNHPQQNPLVVWGSARQGVEETLSPKPAWLRHAKDVCSFAVHAVGAVEVLCSGNLGVKTGPEYLRDNKMGQQ